MLKSEFGMGFSVSVSLIISLVLISTVKSEDDVQLKLLNPKVDGGDSKLAQGSTIDEFYTEGSTYYRKPKPNHGSHSPAGAHLHTKPFAPLHGLRNEFGDILGNPRIDPNHGAKIQASLFGLLGDYKENYGHGGGLHNQFEVKPAISAHLHPTGQHYEPLFAPVFGEHLSGSPPKISHQTKIALFSPVKPIIGAGPYGQLAFPTYDNYNAKPLIASKGPILPIKTLAPAPENILGASYLSELLMDAMPHEKLHRHYHHQDKVILPLNSYNEDKLVNLKLNLNDHVLAAHAHSAHAHAAHKHAAEAHTAHAHANYKQAIHAEAAKAHSTREQTARAYAAAAYAAHVQASYKQAVHAQAAKAHIAQKQAAYAHAARAYSAHVHASHKQAIHADAAQVHFGHKHAAHGNSAYAHVAHKGAVHAHPVKGLFGSELADISINPSLSYGYSYKLVPDSLHHHGAKLSGAKYHHHGGFDVLDKIVAHSALKAAPAIIDGKYGHGHLGLKSHVAFEEHYPGGLLGYGAGHHNHGHLLHDLLH